MTKLSETQRAVLTAALKRKDRCLYPMPTQLKGGAASKVAGSLLKRGLVEEVPAQGEQTVWRQGEDGKSLTLRATKLARNALSGAEEPRSEPVAARRRAQRLRRLHRVSPTLADAERPSRSWWRS